ncbi:MAG: hypothetical protein WD027_09065 [Gaiellales bacterium]
MDQLQRVMQPSVLTTFARFAETQRLMEPTLRERHQEDVSEEGLEDGQRLRQPD